MQEYFEKAYPRPDGGNYYISVRLGHERPTQELRQASADFFESEQNRNQVAYWYQPLQDEDPVEVGYLYGSTPFMSVERLAAEICDRSEGKIAVGCRWHVIALKKYVAGLPKPQRVKAIHIQVQRKQLAVATRFLQRLFTSKRTSNFIMGTKMRLCPLISKVSTVENEAKCAQMRVYQGVFLHELQNSRVFTISDVDFRSKKMDGMSLRDLIMAIPLNAKPSRNLFLSCDTQRDGVVVLTFLASDNVEAYNRSQYLLAYLRFNNPEYSHAITSYFNSSAREEAEHVSWDPDSKMVITLADASLDATGDVADMEDVCPFDPEVAKTFIVDIAMITKVPLPGLTSPSVNEDASLDDTVSTFRSRKKTRFSDATKETVATRPVPRSTPASTPTTARDSSSIGNRSDITSDSALSRLSQVEEQVMKIYEIVSRSYPNHSASFQDQGGPGAGPVS